MAASRPFTRSNKNCVCACACVASENQALVLSVNTLGLSLRTLDETQLFLANAGVFMAVTWFRLIFGGSKL